MASNGTTSVTSIPPSSSGGGSGGSTFTTTPTAVPSSTSNTATPTTAPVTTTPTTSPVPTTTTTTASITPTTPTTTSIPTTTTTTPSPSVISSTVTITPSNSNGGGSGSTVTVTSINSAPTTTTSSRSTSSPSSSPTINSGGSTVGSSEGLRTGGKIAIAVVIPVVVVAALLLAGIFFWRKRKARQAAQEQRKSEMAEYGYNPNNDPTLPAMGAAYTDGFSEPDDQSGYRGWGTTNSNARQPSTTLGSNSRGVGGLAQSETASQPGAVNQQNSPNGASDAYSTDPLMGGHPESADGVGALGGAAAAGGAAAMASRNNRMSQGDIHRGPSNASSQYSHGAPHSESSNDVPTSGYYPEDAPYNVYQDGANHGPYGDGTYGGGEQPVIRDVQARRNTKIERAPTFPQTQGGISQNF